MERRETKIGKEPASCRGKGIPGFFVEMVNVEIWKDTYIYGEQYQVSNTGVVRNKITGHILKPQLDNKGYLRVRMSLHDKKATAKVHRLVAVAFIPNPEDKPQVNHIDADKRNNDVRNLEWVTNGENQIHAYKMGLYRVTGQGGRKKIPVLKVNLVTGEVEGKYSSLAEAAKSNNIHSTNIEKVIRGERHHAGGYAWKRKHED